MNIMVFRWSKSVTLKIINTNRDSLKSADFRDTLRRVLNMNVQLAKMEQKIPRYCFEMSVRSSNVRSSQNDRENRTISTIALEFHYQTIVNYWKDRSFSRRIMIVKTNDRAKRIVLKSPITQIKCSKW